MNLRIFLLLKTNLTQLYAATTPVKHEGIFSMKKIAAILMFMAFISSGIGNAIAKERTNKELALEYLQLSKFEQTINASIDAYSLQLPDADKQQFKKYMREVMGWDAIKDQLSDLVVNLYTREELNAAIAFEKSRLGASITAKNELFAKQFADLLSQNMQRFAKNNSPQPNLETNHPKPENNM
jgi:hypothetical protein